MKMQRQVRRQAIQPLGHVHEAVQSSIVDANLLPSDRHVDHLRAHASVLWKSGARPGKSEVADE